MTRCVADLKDGESRPLTGHAPSRLRWRGGTYIIIEDIKDIKDRSAVPSLHTRLYAGAYRACPKLAYRAHAQSVGAGIEAPLMLFPAAGWVRRARQNFSDHALVKVGITPPRKGRAQTSLMDLRDPPAASGPRFRFGAARKGPATRAGPEKEIDYEWFL
jgi:hypothetical protein